VPRTDGWGIRVAGPIENHEFNDPGVRVLRITQKDRPQLIGVGAEDLPPIPLKAWSNSSLNPSPSRQNLNDRSTSAVQIAA
jgi:hypothetical protein